MQQSTEFLEGQTGKPLSPMKDITSMLKDPKDERNKTIDYVELNTLRMDQAVPGLGLSNLTSSRQDKGLTQTQQRRKN